MSSHGNSDANQDYEEEFLLELGNETDMVDCSAMDYDPFIEEEEEENAVECLSVEKVAVTSDLEVVETEPTIYSFKGVFCQRHFRNQLRPRETFIKEICGNSVAEVIQSLWEAGKDLTKRLVIFNENGPQWSEKEKPSVEDASQFITLQYQAKKKNYCTTTLTPRLLQRWRDKTIKVFVYTYSTNIETSAQFQQVLKQLVTPKNPDRAGANSTRDDSMLANELRQKHPHLEGFHSSWMLWANYINSAEAHERESMRNAVNPPVEISKYFRWVAVSEAARLQSVHRGMQVAQTVNTHWANEIKKIKDNVSMALTLLQGAAQCIEALEARSTVSSELITAMQSAVQPEEAELSRSLISHVTDCSDVDHQ
ncbi:uncharacterized protein LOC131695740 [Topomyia yanbarensis]|uniref:uncharacterized protein LOC131695740 n=1 Tax=Topomyia yanbarensis TaxID=2498891 RepID=UPI00273B7E8B|nr:uncharacterized protein LOC131695740 [Topomyia yanbarensis]